MISVSWVWNISSGILLALIAVAATIEAKSSALISRSLILWPAFMVLTGVATLIQDWAIYGFSVIPPPKGGGITVLLGVVLILAGIQAGLVNIRKLTPWPSGALWLLFIPVGLGFQLYPLFEQRMMGFLWVAVGITKVLRERSASLETGLPTWIVLFYIQAILLAAYR